MKKVEDCWLKAVDLQRDGSTLGSLLEFRGVLRLAQWVKGLMVWLLGAKAVRHPAVCDKECYCSPNFSSVLPDGPLHV